MLHPKDFDVAIVGASIAGCTAAILFARQGLRVVLVERHANPAAYKKLCTHFIQASALGVLDRLELGPGLAAVGAVPNPVDIHTPWGWIREPGDTDPRFPSHGYNLRREKLDPLLRDLACSTPGVEFLPGWTARELIRDQVRIAGLELTDHQGTARQVRARLVVAADGRHSALARLAGVKTRIKPHRRFAYFAYYRGVPATPGGHSQMWLMEPDTAYLFPNDDGLTLLACMITKDKLPAWKGNVADQFHRTQEALPDGPALERAERVSNLVGALHLDNVIRPAAHRGMALIGDAALAADPLWGLGCGWALQSAQWLVDCTVPALAGAGSLEGALNQYRRLHRWRLGGHEFITSDYSTGRPFNVIERLMFSAATRDPAMARHVGRFGRRQIGVGQFLKPTALARAAWVNLTRRPGRTSGRGTQRSGTT